MTKDYDPKAAIADCRQAILDSITRTEVIADDLDRFLDDFGSTFDRNLDPKDGIPWRLAKPHMTEVVSGTIGRLAEFYALADPKKPTKVGARELVKAYAVVKAECAAVRQSFVAEGKSPDEQRIFFCPAELALAAALGITVV